VRRSFARIGLGGIAVALLVATAGLTFERLQLGANDEAAVERVETALRDRLNASAEQLGAIAADAVAARDLIRTSPRDPAVTARLFETLERALPSEETASTGVTVYDRSAAPIAWLGRVSEFDRRQIEAPSSLFVAAGPAGPRLVRVEPVADRDHRTAPRLGTIVAEQAIGDSQTTAGGNTFVLSDLPVRVTIHSNPSRPPATSPYSFVVPSAGGRALVEAEVKPADIAAAHLRWRTLTDAAVLAVLGSALLLCAGVCLELRRRARTRQRFAGATALLFLIVVSSRVVLWYAAAPLVAPRSMTTPVDLLLNALLLALCIWLAIDLVERRRVSAPRRPLVIPTSAVLLSAALGYFAAGFADVGLLWTYELFLKDFVSQATFNLLHFSLHPLNDPARLAMAFGLVIMHAGVIWSAALAIRIVACTWRLRRTLAGPVVALVAWTGGIAVALLTAYRWSPPVPLAPLLLAIATAAVCALVLGQPRGPLRRASQAARLTAAFVGLVVPAIAMYPSLHAFAVIAKEQLVADTFAPGAASQREDLARQLYESLNEIDALPVPTVIEELAENGSPTSNQAFEVWAKTVLAKSRVPSAIELFNARGRLVSRFSKLPEYEALPHIAPNCQWEVVDEPSRFGSSERHVLRASRRVCTANGPAGSIVVRLMHDYRSLPFIASESPYVESLNPERRPLPETATGRDVEFAVYGWSRAPIYTSGPTVWPLPDPVFERMMLSRQAVWANVTREADRFRVYFFNDRFGIYALGYPVTTWVGHLVNLAELVILTGALYVLLLGGRSRPMPA
jgi:hypothetical protein